MKTFFVDAFTDQKFKGNPAAVCLTETELSNSTMQSIATEIGFSETAFIKKIESNTYRVRFFTPKKEIPLCGHATLASSKIIFDTTGIDAITFINCENAELKTRNENDGKIVMQFPVYDTEEIEVPKLMLEALGITTIINTRYNPETRIILIEINDADTLARLSPDFAALIKSYSGINGVLVTARSNNTNFDFHYRYFWPWAGTNEDPVTGGVQTFLSKYWAVKLNKNKFKAFQSSLRTGMMGIELFPDKVLIYGEAVTVLDGELNIGE